MTGNGRGGEPKKDGCCVWLMKQVLYPCAGQRLTSGGVSKQSIVKSYENQSNICNRSKIGKQFPFLFAIESHFLQSLSGIPSACPLLLSGWQFGFEYYEAITAKMLACNFIVVYSFVLRINALAFAFRRFPLCFHCHYTSKPINQCQNLNE